MMEPCGTPGMPGETSALTGPGDVGLAGVSRRAGISVPLGTGAIAPAGGELGASANDVTVLLSRERRRIGTASGGGGCAVVGCAAGCVARERCALAAGAGARSGGSAAIGAAGADESGPGDAGGSARR